MPRDHQQKQGPPRAHTKVPIGLLLCEMDKFDLKLYVACILNFHRHFLRGQIASIKIIISRLYRQCTIVQAVYKKQELQSQLLPLWLTPVLESFPAPGAWRKPGKTLRGSLSINTGVVLSPRAAYYKPPAGRKLFPMLGLHQNWDQT